MREKIQFATLHTHLDTDERDEEALDKHLLATAEKTNTNRSTTYAQNLSNFLPSRLKIKNNNDRRLNTDINRDTLSSQKLNKIIQAKANRVHTMAASTARHRPIKRNSKVFIFEKEIPKNEKSNRVGRPQTAKASFTNNTAIYEDITGNASKRRFERAIKKIEKKSEKNHSADPFSKPNRYLRMKYHGFSWNKKRYAIDRAISLGVKEKKPVVKLTRTDRIFEKDNLPITERPR